MYKKRNIEWLRHLDFEILDLLIMLALMFLVAHFRGAVVASLSVRTYILRYALMVFLDILVIDIIHPYKNIMQRGYWKEFTAVVRQFTFIYFLVIVAFYIIHDAELLPRLSIMLEWGGSVILAYCCHWLRKWRLRRKMQFGNELPQMMVISDGECIDESLKQLKIKPYTAYQIVAIVLLDNRKVKDHIIDKNGRILYGIDSAYEYARTHVVDEVFIDNSVDKLRPIVDNFLEMGIVVHISIPEFDQDLPHKSLNHFGNRYVVTTTINAVPSWQLSVKRLVDICAAIVGLIITGLAGLFIVPAIKIADPGPAIFAQKRVGKNGRVFKFYKFRSMYMDAEARKAELMDQNEMKGLMFKIENDPRIIGYDKGEGKGLGNFLRKTSLDELPQFWNILIGDMSLIGTRPPTFDEYQQYETRHKIRLSMKPGLTGMWQVSGRSNITDFEEVVRLDTEYIENWSIGLDIKILLQTFLVVFGKKGSK